MECRKVLPLLSEYLDEALAPDIAIEVSHHLNQCLPCRKEFDTLASVQTRLHALRRVPEPDYLGDLVRLRIADRRRNRWSIQLRDALEFRWSRIRTTGWLWYLTRAAGTLMTAVFFSLIPFSINPPEIEANASRPERKVFTVEEKQQVALNFLARLGMLPEDARKDLTRSIWAATSPAINDRVLSNIGESISQDGEDYMFSVLTSVDRIGQAEAERVIEHPNDRHFLESFNKVIASGRFSPARQNGKTIDSRMIMVFSKISVSD